VGKVRLMAKSNVALLSKRLAVGLMVLVALYFAISNELVRLGIDTSPGFFQVYLQIALSAVATRLYISGVTSTPTRVWKSVRTSAIYAAILCMFPLGSAWFRNGPQQLEVGATILLVLFVGPVVLLSTVLALLPFRALDR
jgi:hypothetical protein